MNQVTAWSFLWSMSNHHIYIFIIFIKFTFHLSILLLVLFCKSSCTCFKMYSITHSMSVCGMWDCVFCCLCGLCYDVGIIVVFWSSGCAVGCCPLLKTLSYSCLTLKLPDSLCKLLSPWLPFTVTFWESDIGIYIHTRLPNAPTSHVLSHLLTEGKIMESIRICWVACNI